MSPRLAALAQALEKEGGRALESFWGHFPPGSTPLVEDNGSGDHVLLTFLWRATGSSIRNVAIEGGPGGAGLNPLFNMAGTDLWYRSYRVPRDTRCMYRFLENVPDMDPEEGALTPWSVIMQNLSRISSDPLNPRRMGAFPQEESPRFVRDLTSSVIELPGAPPQPWADPHREGLAGTVEEHWLASDVLANERRVWVYTPRPEPTGAEAYPWLLVFDGVLMVTPTLALPTTLDNLIAAGRIPPLMAVMVDNPDPPTRLRELPCHPPFVDFLGTELVPWVRERYPVTSDPHRTIVGGASHGGLAAAFAGLRRPDLFGNVLSISGSFWWRPPGDTEPEWLARQLASGRLLPAKWYLDVGRFETGTAPDGGPDTLTCNRHLRDVLVAGGASPRYSEYSGGHDTICWRGSVADGIMALTEEWETTC